MTCRACCVSVCVWERKMLALYRPKLKRIFAGESLKQFRKVFRKPKRLRCSG